jgi:hypothetical protein
MLSLFGPAAAEMSVTGNTFPDSASSQETVVTFTFALTGRPRHSKYALHEAGTILTMVMVLSCQHQTALLPECIPPVAVEKNGDGYFPDYAVPRGVCGGDVADCEIKTECSLTGHTRRHWFCSCRENEWQCTDQNDAPQSICLDRTDVSGGDGER